MIRIAYPVRLTVFYTVLYLAHLRQLPEVSVGLMIVRKNCYYSVLALHAKYAILPTAHRTVALHVVTAVTQQPGQAFQPRARPFNALDAVERSEKCLKFILSLM